jgi:glycosyltransferase involved in cell wall biosynthesis
LANAKKRIVSFLLSQTTCLNVVSNDAKDNLLDYFPALRKHSDKILVIQNGIDTMYFAEKVNDKKSIYDIVGIDKDTFVIGYFGRFMPEKGFPILIDAIDLVCKAKRTDKRIKVLALGWGAYIREYKLSIHEKKLDEYFIFIEFQKDVRWVLKQISLLVIPSLREACPLLPMESLVSGTPIVASNCVGLREVLQDTPATMVESENSHELANAILDKINNYDKKSALDFIEKAKKRFDAKIAAEKLERLFQQVCRSITKD